MLHIILDSRLEYMQNNNNNDTFDVDQSSLTLATCYLFDGVLPYPTRRYIVLGMPYKINLSSIKDINNNFS